MIPPRVPVVELFAAQGTRILGFSSVYLHVILHLLLSGKRATTGWTFVWFLVQVYRLDMLIQNGHFVVSISAESADVIF